MSNEITIAAGSSAGTALQPLPYPVALRPVPEWKDPIRLSESIHLPARRGLSVIIFFVGGFLLYASIIPLSGGAMAPGLISPDGSRRSVQHLEGGIIAELIVRDGDTVSAGDPLVVLESVAQRGSHETLVGMHYTLLAKQARINAEKAGKATVSFPPELRDGGEEARIASEAQRHIFESRTSNYTNRRALISQRVRQLEEQIKGTRAQATSMSEQLKLVKEEYTAKDTLYVKGLIARPEMLRLKGKEAEFMGRLGEYQANIATATQQMGESRIQLSALDSERTELLDQESDKVRVELADALERRRSAADVLKRTVVTAPVDGTVVNMKFKTKGGVVQRGEMILELVPTNDALLIDARISPLDVRLVHIGLPAQVHFSAYSSRTAPRIKGIVKSLSADRLVDPVTQQPYYLARVLVDREEMERRAPKVQMIPGMPADVLIVTESRTILEFMFKPFTDALRRSFREA